MTDTESIISSEDLAALICDALLDANLIQKNDLKKSVEIASEEIEVRKSMKDYWCKLCPKLKASIESLPTFTDGRILKKVWVNHNNDERVYIFISQNGTWGMWGEYFSNHEAEMCWCPNDMGGHFFDSETTAIKELKASYPWAKSVQAMDL